MCLTNVTPKILHNTITTCTTMELSISVTVKVGRQASGELRDTLALLLREMQRLFSTTPHGPGRPKNLHHLFRWNPVWVHVTKASIGDSKLALQQVVQGSPNSGEDNLQRPCDFRRDPAGYEDGWIDRFFIEMLCSTHRTPFDNNNEKWINYLKAVIPHSIMNNNSQVTWLNY